MATQRSVFFGTFVVFVCLCSVLVRFRSLLLAVCIVLCWLLPFVLFLVFVCLSVAWFWFAGFFFVAVCLVVRI